MKSLTQNAKIVLLANDKVGLEIARYLKNRKENIIALVLHSPQNSKFFDEIKKTVKIQNIFLANQITLPNYLEKIKSLRPDIAICAWFGHILKEDFISIFPAGCVNLHNSYLPLNRGKYPQAWAIYTNSKYGVTIHYIDKKIDTGPIIARKEIKIEPTDTAGSLYEKSLKEIIKLFIIKWPKIKNGFIKPIIQNNKAATLHMAQDITKLDFIDLDKKDTAKNFINQLRARSFQDRTYAHFICDGKKIYAKLTLSNEQNF